MLWPPPVLLRVVRCVRRRGGSVPARNDEGRVQIEGRRGRGTVNGTVIEGRRCLCYLPHCTRQLYANLLAANWGAHQLPRLVVIGNASGDF